MIWVDLDQQNVFLFVKIDMLHLTVDVKDIVWYRQIAASIKSFHLLRGNKNKNGLDGNQRMTADSVENIFFLISRYAVD